MKSVSRSVGVGLALLVLAHSGAMPLDRSISTSRQFLVFGPDFRLRGAICDLAERTKLEILQLVGQRDTWKTPIVIDAQSPQANLPEMRRASLSLSQTGFGLRLQLDLKITSGMSQPEIRRELLCAILLEMIYRRAPDLPVGATYVFPPEWLLDGVATDNGGTTVNGATVSAAHKIFPLEEFLRMCPDSLDGPSRSLYRLSSAALVERLIRLPDGQQRLARFIFDLPGASDDNFAHFRKHFPELFETTSNLQKASILQIAGPPPQLLSAEESKRILEGMLSLRIPEGESGKEYQLSEFPVFIRDLSARGVLNRLRWNLRALVARANPVYRPVICEYEKTAAMLARGKTRGIAERLARLSATRRMLGVRMGKVTDYMNWFEAERASRPSGLFVDYLKTADLADSAAERRRDPISVYLDVFETQFQN